MPSMESTGISVVPTVIVAPELSSGVLIVTLTELTPSCVKLTVPVIAAAFGISMATLFVEVVPLIEVLIERARIVVAV